MGRLKKFLKFVKKNPPPYLPGEPLYWFDESTGGIRKSETNTILALNENWEWKVFDDEDPECGNTCNESPFFCTTRKKAKKFRDKVECVCYSVFIPDSAGDYTVDGKSYSLVKKSSLNTKKLKIDDDYFTATLRDDSDVEVGSVISFDHFSGYVLEGGAYEQCFVHLKDEEMSN